MKRLVLVYLLCLQAIGMMADVVKGRVVDADSGEALEGAIVGIEQNIHSAGYSVIIHRSMSTDSVGCFRYPVDEMSQLTLTINYIGYKESKKNFNCAGGKDTLDLGDLKLKMSDEMLKEVLVTAKARRFHMKGDTVIFNPEAFNMEDGARVAELMKKLPGVSIQDGRIYFMGKEVHLKMNGHDVKDDFLIAQLPAEAVQNVKAYEKKSELAELSGMNDGQEKQVLDITIKPGFLDKWYGQTTTSAYASKNYRASANMHYLSEMNPFGLYARVSDNGSHTGSVWDNGEWDYDNAIPQRNQYGKLSYSHNWKIKRAESSYDEDNWHIDTSPGHLDTYQNSWQNTETFLSGQPSSFSNSHSYNYNHSWNIPLAFSTSLHFGPRTAFLLDVSGGYEKGECRSSDEQKTYRGDTYTEDPQSLVNSTTTERITLNDKKSLTSLMYLSRVWENADFYAMLNMDYAHNNDNSDNHSEYDYRELGRMETLEQSEKNKRNNFEAIFDSKYSFQIIPKKVKAGVAYWFYGLHNTSESDMLANGEYDIANSYNRKKSTIFNEPRVEVEADLGKVWMLGRIKLANSDERLDYQRGNLDTLIHHNTWFTRPHFEIKWKTTKTTELKGGVDWEHQTADMLESSAYIDDTNPLYITMGNPNLKGTSTLRSDLAYSMMFTKGQQMLNWSLSYNRTFDPVGGVSAYNSQTGGYTSTKTNVDDSERWATDLNYDRALGQYFRLRSSVGYGNSKTYGVKTMTSLDDPMEQFSQKSSYLNGNIRITFQDNGWEATAMSFFNHNKVSYSDTSLNGQDLWNYRIGMNGNYKLTHWTFEIDTYLVGYSGYLSDMMNRNRLALNASITWKMLKNKGQLILSAKDILNEMDDVNYSNSPTTRNESRSETFHRYLSLTFKYNFDAKAKKGK